MATGIKRMLIILAALVALLLLAAVLVPILFKDKLEQAAKEQVNQQVNATVDWGPWSLSVFKNFPNITVGVKELQVCNKAPFEGTCLAEVGKVELTLGFWSLFQDRVNLKNVRLDEPRIHLVVLEDGTANWDITIPDTATVGAEEDTAAISFDIALRKYAINDGLVIYDDRSMPFLLELRGVDHTGKGDFTQDFFTLHTRTAVQQATMAYAGVKYINKAKADLVADLDMDLPAMKFTVKDGDLQVNRLQLGVDGWLAMPEDDIDMDLTWGLKKSDIGAILSLVPAEFASDLDGVDMSGSAAFNGYVKGTYNEQTMPGFGLTIAMENGRLKYPDLPASVDDIFLDCTINSPQSHDMDALVVDLKRLAFNMAGNPVEAHLKLATPISDPQVDAALKAKVDLANVQKVVPLAKGGELQGKVDADVALAGRMSDVDQQRYERFKAEGTLALSGMTYTSDPLPYAIDIQQLIFNFNPRFLELGQFTGHIGNSDIKATGRLDNYLQWWLQDSVLAGNFNVQSDRIDLNQFMSGEEETTAQADTAAAPAQGVIEIPDRIDFNLAATANEVLFDNLKLTQARGDLKVHDRQLTLKGLGFNIFDGRMTMDGTYATPKEAPPSFGLAMDVNNVDINQLVEGVEAVKAMAPVALYCKGRMTTTINLTGTLDDSMSPVMNSLNGKGTLSTKQVVLEGFKPLETMASVLKMPQIAKADLENLNFSYLIEDGKMVTHPFDVKIDRMTATVQGTTAFEDQAIDYTLKAKVPTAMFGSGAEELLSGLVGKLNTAVGAHVAMPETVDLTASITGTVAKPIVKPVFAGGKDVKEMIKEEVKEQVNVRIDEAKEAAIARAKEEAERLVAEAQKQADEIKAKARSEAASAKTKAYEAADRLVEEAKNPLAKAAAKVAADKAKQRADEAETKFINEADQRADGLVQAAREKGDGLIRKAEETDTTIK